MGCHEGGRRDFGNDLPRLPTGMPGKSCSRAPDRGPGIDNHDRASSRPRIGSGTRQTGYPCESDTERAVRSRTICNGAAGKSALSS